MKSLEELLAIRDKAKAAMTDREGNPCRSRHGNLRNRSRRTSRSQRIR